MEQQNALRVEQEKFPLVGASVPLSNLVAEVSGEPTLLRKATELAFKYRAMRSVRRDGSCFIRCVIFGVLELFPRHPAVVSRIHETLRSVRSPLRALYSDFVDDFCDVMEDTFRTVLAGRARTEDALIALVTSPAQSEYLVCFIRYCISWWMRSITRFIL